MDDDQHPAYVFREGDHALIVDRRGRHYLVQLDSSASFHTHVGNFPHADLIGQNEGTWVTTAQGHNLIAFKPSLADFTRDMPRIATVVYPKDIGAIITYGDIFPGATVLEAGSGSGALTLALLRAVGTSGRVIAYDIRADMIERTEANVASIHEEAPNLELKQGDVYEGISESGLGQDRARSAGALASGLSRVGRPGSGWCLRELLAHCPAGPRADSGLEKATHL